MTLRCLFLRGNIAETGVEPDDIVLPIPVG